MRTRLQFALLALFALVSLEAAAQTSFGVAPGMVVQEFTPGQPFQFDLQITNGTGTDIEMRSSVTDFWYNADNQKTFGPAGTSPQSAANWIEVVPKRFTIPAHHSIKITAVVTPPAQASGGYYAAVFAESKPELTSAGNAEHKAIFTNVRIGSLVMLTAKNTGNVNVGAADYKLDSPTDAKPLELSAAFSNNGNVHVFAQPYLIITNEKHDLVGKVEGEAHRFLPKQQDRLAVRYTGKLPPGKYQAVLAIAYGDGKVISKDFDFEINGARQ